MKVVEHSDEYEVVNEVKEQQGNKVKVKVKVKLIVTNQIIENDQANYVLETPKP